MSKGVLLDGKVALPNEWINEVDLLGKDVTVTIAEVKVEEMRDMGKGKGDKKKGNQLVLYIKERPGRKLGLNDTNLKAIIRLHGKNANDWVGKQITLYPTTCNAFGDPRTPCVRIRGKDGA